MLYIIGFGHSWFKVGVAGDMKKRCTIGFWNNKHPPELCNKLNTYKPIAFFQGGKDLEAIMHSLFPPDCGEFYEISRLKGIIEMASLFLDPLPLQELPVPSQYEKQSCCGGSNGNYKRADHMRRAFATTGKKSLCPRCNKPISIRNDKVKEHLKRCKGGAFP